MRLGSGNTAICCALLGGLIAAAASAQTAGRTSGLSWDGCAAPPSNRSFACDTNTGTPFELVMWLKPFPSFESHAVTGAEAGLTIQTPDPVLPSWWRIDPGGCRAGVASLTTTSTVLPGCADAWGGLASGSIEYVPAAYCPPNVLGLRLGIAMPAGQSRVLVGEPYALFRIRVTRAGTAGPGSCDGCTSPACFITNGISLFGATQPGWGYSTFDVASWQGASCRWNTYCSGPTPVLPSTWGSIKAIYR